MIEALGNLGDFIGGMGVIITVIYLAIQVKRNTESNQATAYQAVVASLSDWSMSLGLNENMTRIVAVGAADRNALNDGEKDQFNMVFTSLIRHFENVHFQHVSGAITKDQWEGWESRIRGTFASPGVSEFWKEQQLAFSPVFREFIESQHNDVTKTALPFGSKGFQHDA